MEVIRDNLKEVGGVVEEIEGGRGDGNAEMMRGKEVWIWLTGLVSF